LIKRCSEPNVETWVKLAGKLKGVYDSLAAAEEALDMLSGETATESEAKRLAAVGEAAARKPVKKAAKIPEKSSQSAFEHSTPVTAHSRVSESTAIRQ